MACIETTGLVHGIVTVTRCVEVDRELGKNAPERGSHVRPDVYGISNS